MQTFGEESPGEDHHKSMASSSESMIVDVPDTYSIEGTGSSPESPAGSAEAVEETERILRLRQVGLQKAKEGFTPADFEGFTRVAKPGYTQTAPDEDIKKEMFDKLGADCANPRTRELGFLKTSTNKSRYFLSLKVERLILTLFMWSFFLPVLTLLHDFFLGPLLILTGFLSYYQVPRKAFVIFYSVFFTVMCLRYSALDLKSSNCKLLEIAELIRCEVLISLLKCYHVKRCCPFTGEAVKTKYFIIPEGTRNTAKLSVGCRVKEWVAVVKTEIVAKNFTAFFTGDGHIEIRDYTSALLCKRKLQDSETGPVYSFFEYFKRNEQNLVCADGDINNGVLHALSIDEILNLIVSDNQLLQCETTHDVLVLGAV